MYVDNVLLICCHKLSMVLLWWTPVEVSTKWRLWFTLSHSIHSLLLPNYHKPSNNHYIHSCSFPNPLLYTSNFQSLLCPVVDSNQEHTRPEPLNTSKYPLSINCMKLFQTSTILLTSSTFNFLRLSFDIFQHLFFNKLPQICHSVASKTLVVKKYYSS